MRFFILILVFSVLIGCGTVGGALRGMGSDFDLVGSYLFEG